MHGLTPCPSGHNASHFRMHGSHPAPFLNPPTLLAPNHPIFGLADPFWLRRVPFLTHRPHPALHARFLTPRPLLAATRPFFGRTNPSLPFMPHFWTCRPLRARDAFLFGCTDPFWPQR